MTPENDDRRKDPSLFLQPWWLDAVAPNSWSEVKVERGGRVVARLPFEIRKKFGLVVLKVPALTQYLGPWMEPTNGKYASVLADQKDLMDALIAQLPKALIFRQRFSPEITNWLPFHWRGFTASPCYTYRIAAKDPAGAWDDLLPKIRTDIRKAEKTLKIREDLSIEKFLDLNDLTFARQNLPTPYERDLPRRIHTACTERQACKILCAVDGDEKLHAAIFLVWDASTVYYLMAGSDPALRNSGAMSLLLWEGIRFALSTGRIFDFEGSMIESVERFVRGFGAKQTVYFEVTRASILVSLLLLLRKKFKR